MFVGILNPALHYILWGPAKAQPVYSTGCILEKIGDTGGDKSLSASPWVSNHTRGHQQSVFEALPLHFQGPTLRPHYKSAYTHILDLEEHISSTWLCFNIWHLIQKQQNLPFQVQILFFFCSIH